jgi:hypothetical protein
MFICVFHGEDLCLFCLNDFSEFFLHVILGIESCAAVWAVEGFVIVSPNLNECIREHKNHTTGTSHFRKCYHSGQLLSKVQSSNTQIIPNVTSTAINHATHHSTACLTIGFIYNPPLHPFRFLLPTPVKSRSCQPMPFRPWPTAH